MSSQMYQGLERSSLPKRLDDPEVPGLELVPEPGSNGAAGGEQIASVGVGHGEVGAAGAGGADDEGNAGVEDDLFGTGIVEDVVLVAAALVDKGHLDDADAIDDGRLGEDGGRDVGGCADDEDVQTVIFREGL